MSILSVHYLFTIKLIISMKFSQYPNSFFVYYYKMPCYQNLLAVYGCAKELFSYV